jgi:hypothetical protein
VVNKNKYRGPNWQQVNFTKDVYYRLELPFKISCIFAA